MQRSPGVYTAGTIYGQINTRQIVGAGTSWMVADGGGSLVSNIAPLDWLWVDGQEPILIKSIEDDQHLTLGSNLPFGIPAGTAYTIIKATVSPSLGVQGILQKVLALGTAASPLTYEAFDNGVSAFRLGFADDGRIQLEVGATGADGSGQRPWHAALLIDPATGNVTATGLTGGGPGVGNQFWYITGRPPNAIGIDGDVNFDFVSGFVVYRKAAGSWSAGLDIFAALEDAVIQSAAAAAASAALAQGWASTPDDTDVPNAAPGSRSAKHYADKAGGSATAARNSASAADASAQAAGGAAAAAVAGKANKGDNTDITSLGGLTTALSIAQGGTGGKTPADARMALIGYTPARSGGYFAQAFSSTSNLAFPGYLSLGTIQFVATAAQVSCAGRCAVATSDGSTETVYAYVDILDNVTGSAIATGVTDICTATSTAYGKAVAGCGSASLVVGKTYTARFWASQSDGNHNVGARNPVLEVRNFG